MQVEALLRADPPSRKSYQMLRQTHSVTGVSELGKFIRHNRKILRRRKNCTSVVMSYWLWEVSQQVTRFGLDDRSSIISKSFPGIREIMLILL